MIRKGLGTRILSRFERHSSQEPRNRALRTRFGPGPALAGLGLGNPATVLFVFSILAGMGGHTALPSVLSRRAKQAVRITTSWAAPHPDDGLAPPRNPAMSSG